MTVSPTLDNRFREAAAAAGLLDVAYDFTDTPVGTLLLATTDRGVCRISYDSDPGRAAEGLAHTFGSRVLRASKPVDSVRRQLDEYFDGKRTAFELPLDLRAAAPFTREVLKRLRLPGSSTSCTTLRRRRSARCSSRRRTVGSAASPTTRSRSARPSR